MTQPIIAIENLSKCYLVGHQSAQAERYTALRDVLGRSFKNFGRKLRDFASGKQIVQGDEVEKFWALKEVSFDIHEGEVVGIVGRNGAGKSTLLKILSRITEPTSGRVVLRGKVASLLEVGTGFHPELTGRENIFLNGSVLGMTQSMIRRRFDEIVEFAEVEKFLDTPVKRYSSGMYVRLAFAVAAHLDPNILVIDEVLAVGDSQFQKKCLGKMSEVASSGRTVLYVSHNMASVLNLCTRAVHLDHGQVRNYGPTSDIVSGYLNEASLVTAEYDTEANADVCSKSIPYFKLTRFALQCESLPFCSTIPAESNAVLDVVIEGDVREVDPRFNLGIGLLNEQGECLILSFSTDQPECEWPAFKPGSVNRIRTQIDTSILNEGTYHLYLLSSLHCVRMLWSTVDEIRVGFEIVGNRGNSPYWTTKRGSSLAPRISWKLSD